MTDLSNERTVTVRFDKGPPDRAADVPPAVSDAFGDRVGDARQAPVVSAGTGQDSQAAPSPEPRVRLRTTSGAGTTTFIAAAGASLGLIWVLYERVLPFSGVLGFWVSWYVLFLGLYFTMARLQWDHLEARNRLAAVAFGTGGASLAVGLWWIGTSALGG